MKILLSILFVISLSVQVGGYSKKYCDICSEQVTDESAYVSTTHKVYTDLCPECYMYLRIRLEECVDDIRKARVMIHRMEVK